MNGASPESFLSEWQQTALSSILLLIFGQIVIRFIFEPLHSQAGVCARIVAALIFHANIYSNGSPSAKPELVDETSRVFRHLASLLVSSTMAIPGYGLLHWLFRRPSLKDVRIAAAALILLSNAAGYSGPRERIEKAREDIKRALHIKSGLL